jgi:Na+-transporting NADH:ubiquinone oxidoreductase subunit NqrE
MLSEAYALFGRCGYAKRMLLALCLSYGMESYCSCSSDVVMMFGLGSVVCYVWSLALGKVAALMRCLGCSVALCVCCQ